MKGAGNGEEVRESWKGTKRDRERESDDKAGRSMYSKAATNS